MQSAKLVPYLKMVQTALSVNIMFHINDEDDMIFFKVLQRF